MEKQMTITKAKSVCFKLFVREIDDILSKIHNKSVDGDPLTENHPEWFSARERLISIKVGGPHFGTFPINFQLANHLILSELAHREDYCKEHHDAYVEKMRLVN